MVPWARHRRRPTCSQALAVHFLKLSWLMTKKKKAVERPHIRIPTVLQVERRAARREVRQGRHIQSSHKSRRRNKKTTRCSADNSATKRTRPRQRSQTCG